MRKSCRCLGLVLLTSLAASAHAEQPLLSLSFAASDGALDPAQFEIITGTGAPDLPGWGNRELETYRADPANLFVRDGKLHIVARLADKAAQGPSQATSARIMTRPGVLPQYGAYEIRARLPCGRGYWPAIWMLGEKGAWPARGEIDIVEWSGRYFNENELQSALHAPAYFAANAKVARRAVRAACGATHTYQLLWAPDRIGFGVDGDPLHPTVLFRKPKDARAEDWPFDQAFQLIFNVAVGGDLGGDPDPRHPTAEMVVEWVRVWALK